MTGIQAKSTPCYDFEGRVTQTYTCICLYSSFRIPFGFPGFEFFLSKLHRSKALYRQVKRMLAKAYSQAIRYAFPEYTLSATLLSLLSGLSGNRSRIATEGFRKGLFNVRLPEMPVRRDREADKAELVG